VQARDTKGNWSDFGSASVEIDTLPPTATINGLENYDLLVGETAELTIGGTDVVSYNYILVKVPGGQIANFNQTPISTKLTINFNVAGRYTLLVGGTDTAGNITNLFGGNPTTLTWDVV